MKFWILLFFSAVFLSCRPAYDYVHITGSDAYPQERAFLESLFEEDAEIAALGLRLTESTDNSRRSPRPAMFIEFLSSWEHDGDILISTTVFVPREDALAGRSSTSLASCLEGNETLVRPHEIEPPFVALRVDGRSLEDENYPLVQAVYISIRTDEERIPAPRLQEKMYRLEEILQAAPKPLLARPSAPIWLVAGGDTMLGRGASEILFREGPEGIFGATAEMLASADIAMLNLEGMISNMGERIPKSFHFRFVPQTAPALKNAGIDVVLHANNHVFDYGKDAFLDSLTRLSRAGIGIAGAGIDIESASDPFVFSRGDEVCLVFGLASFPRERNGWDGISAAAGPGLAGMLHAGRGGAQMLKSKFSPEALNVVLFHGGTEWSNSPDAATRALYTDLIAAGADLVIGSHPHIVQGFEWVHGKPVFWSLGNYVFSGMQNTGGGDEGLLIRLGFWQGRLLYLEPFALTLNGPRTNIAPPEKLETFYIRSRELREQNSRAR